MPTTPVPAPLMERLRSLATFVPAAPLAESLRLTPLVPAARMEANVPPPSMVMLLVMVTVPKPPGSTQSISPPSAVFEMAPAKVLQGAVRLQGFASSPTPDTHVLVACACAADAQARVTTRKVSALRAKRVLFIAEVSLSLGKA